LMRQIFLHIGLHKTGTSYLQKLLSFNAADLLEAGVDLPPVKTGYAHHELVKELIQFGPQHFLDRFDWGRADKILISSETLSHAFRSQELSMALGQAAKKNQIQLTLILFLRRQDHLKESVFSEIVKTWYEGSILDDHHYDYDFNRRAMNLELAFGQENVRIVLYGNHAFRPLWNGLIEQLNLNPPPKTLAEVTSQNVGMHRRKTLFLSQVPKHDQRFAIRVRNVVEDTLAIKDDGVRYLMSPSQRSELLARYLAGNEALFKRHDLPESNWFQPLSPGETDWVSPSPIQSQEYMGVMSEALGASSELPGGRNMQASRDE
jgi:hypothetical protein